jgi:microcystin-dependent protein
MAPADNGKVGQLNTSAAGFVPTNSSGVIGTARVITAGTAVSVTNGDGSAGNPTINFDPTGLTGNRTWGNGSNASLTWTWDLSGTDPVLTVGSGVLNVTTGSLQVSGVDVATISGSQILTNKTINNCAIHNPTGLTSADVGLGNVDNTSDANKPVSVPIEIRLQGKQDTAVKGFAQGYASLDAAGKVPIDQIPTSLIGGNASFQTSWNAATNTPPIPAATPANNGFYYLVAVAGTTSIDGINVWAVGDTIISDGAVWKKIQATSAVTSVAGKIGAVTLVKGDVGLPNVDNTSDATKNAAVVTITNHTIKGTQNALEVRLDADVVGNLPTARLNGGAGANDHTWWCGDNTWKQPSGTGNVSGVASSVVGESAVFSDTDGKQIKGYAGPAGFAILTPGNATTAKPKIQMADIDANDFHAMTEKTATVEDDEFVLWDSVTGTLQKVKKKNLGVPVGTIVSWAGRPGNQPDNVANACPQGWLICNAKQYPTATYPALFAVIGYGYGGSGANFAVPDTRGLVTAGRDYSEANGGDSGRLSTHGAARYTIGAGMGAQTDTLNLNTIPSHQHGTFILGYHNAVTNGNYGLASINCGIPCGVGFNGSVFIYDGNARGGYIRYDAAGGNQAHNNTQPTVIFWKIIKY